MSKVFFRKMTIELSSNLSKNDVNNIMPEI